MKFKRKLLLTLGLVAMFIFMLAISTFAIEITITYYNGSNIDTSIDGDGIMEVEEGAEFTLPTKEVDAGYSSNWYTTDGRAWSGGAKIKLNEDTKLYHKAALDVADYATFKKCASSGTTIRLTEDITVPNEQVGTVNWGTFMVLLNGHNIDFTRTNGTAIGGQRTGTLYYGVGKITYNGNQFQEAKNHGWGGDCCRLFVGRDVEIYAPNAILVFDGDGYVSQGYPYIQIYGKVTCKTVLEMRNSVSRAPRVEVNEGALLTVKGALLSHTQAGNSINVNVRGGTIIMENSTYSFFRDQSAKYNITGGNFLFAEETDFTQVGLYIDREQYKIVDITVNKAIYQCVVPYKCGNTTENPEHVFKLSETIEASCCNFKTEKYFCDNCSHEIEFRYGDRTGHNYVFAESKEATKTELGWEKSICDGCQSVQYVFVAYDPTNDTVKVVISTDEGNVTKDVLIKKIYTLTKANEQYTITDVLAFDEYELSQIVGIYIPIGVTYVNLSTANTYIKELVIADTANVTITSVAKLSALEKITIMDADVKFAAKCAPASLKAIDSTVEGANVTFEKEAFTGITNLSSLDMCKGSTYSFAQDSFKKTSIKKLVFPDNVTVKFTAKAAFYESNIEELYIGKGITNFGQNETFKMCKSLKKIIIMDLTTINDGMFQQISSDAIVYHHALTLSAGNNSFASNTNISIYTKAALTNGSAFNSCNGYTIHYGINHEYEKTTKDASCTSEGGTIYQTICPCGENSNVIYKKFVNNVTSSTTYEIVELNNITTPKLAHSFETLTGIKYENGFGSMGVGEYECGACHVKELESVATQAPIFKCLGYSVREAGGYAMTVKYEINKTSIENYEAINNVTLEYGMVVGNKMILGASSPLSSTATVNKGGAKYNMSNKDFVVFEVSIKNIPLANLDTSYVLSAYVYDGKNVYYLQENQTVENPSGISYNEIYDVVNYAS
ncbi:MAG: leucine-rich repeat protein [Clostridia bacterium]|nr:leucine-rich repeat protein [Clostridia bacterium]